MIPRSGTWVFFRHPQRKIAIEKADGIEQLLAVFKTEPIHDVVDSDFIFDMGRSSCSRQ